MTTVLVTGAGGFVGRHLVAYLRAEHPEVEVVGLVRAHATAHARRPPRVTFLEGDLDDPAAADAVFESVRPDRIVHLAGQSSVQHSWIDPGGTLRTNVLGLAHLLDAASRRALSARVLVVGSADEYGMVPPERTPVQETEPLRPRSPYAVSKVAQAGLALQYGSPGGLEVVLTRTFPHTGPGRGEAFAESSFARQIVEIEAGRCPPVLSVGNLDAVRDFTDVRDVVCAYWALLEHGRAGEAYNVCTGRAVRIGEVLDELIRLAGVTVDVRLDPARLRPSDIPLLVGHPGKLEEATGWKPKVPAERMWRDLLEDWRRRAGTLPEPRLA